MKHVRKSVLLWYSPREMYSLVTDVAAYPSFLPWCERAEVLERHDEKKKDWEREKGRLMRHKVSGPSKD